MYPAILLHRLQEVEDLMRRLEETIERQRQMIAWLVVADHDARGARLFLARLEANYAKHVGARDQLITPALGSAHVP